MNINLNTKYYYVINEDLKMSKGKIAAQVSHVAMELSQEYNEVGKAVILKAPEKKLGSLISNKDLFPVFIIQDAGLTEVPKGSLTCIGFKERDKTNEFTKDLKLV